MPEERAADVDLRRALRDAANASRAARAEYESGLIDDEELRRAQFRAGLVIGLREAWLLDLDAGVWVHYDGVAVRRTESPDAETVEDP